MFTVTRTEVRPSDAVEFYELSLGITAKHIKQLMGAHAIARAQSLTTDGLTRNITITAPTEAIFRSFMDDVIVNHELVVTRDAYNAANGITVTVAFSS
jgi:hypothetical protein